MTHGILMALLLAVPQQAFSPQEFAKRMDALGEPARVFADTCILHSVIASDLPEKLNANPDYLSYNYEQSKPFLRGRGGNVWGKQGKETRYAVSLTDSGICSTYAQSFDSARAFSNLKELIDLLYPGNSAQKMPGDQAGPNDDSVASEGWQLYDGRTQRDYYFTVNTPKKDGAIFDAVYTVHVVPRSAP